MPYSLILSCTPHARIGRNQPITPAGSSIEELIEGCGHGRELDGELASSV